MNGLLAMLVAMTVAAEVSSRTVPYYSATKLAVQLPRGGGGVFGTNLSKEKLAGIFVLQMAANAVIAMPAPGKMLELYGSNAPKKGSAADVFMHYIESALTAIAILTYLSVYTDAEIRTMAIWGTTPNMYQTWNLFLHGSYKSAGFHDGFGVALLLSYAPAVLLWTGKGDTALVIKYFAVVCGLLSLLLIFGSDDLAKSMFGVSVADGTSLASE